uniref:Large ribosomal subunit protein bL32m n=1 Tax=Eptatretus burgeri TaxID=7764 RepID=A0A8C4WWB7_EPTBU
MAAWQLIRRVTAAVLSDLERGLRGLLAGNEQLVPLLAFPHYPHTFSRASKSDDFKVPSILDEAVLWMAAPKNRRTIEVNRTRRRADRKLLKPRRDIELCPNCSEPKLKHRLCGNCYSYVAFETKNIRQKIAWLEGGPLRTPAMETVVHYNDDAPVTNLGKRIVEQKRKRPHWFPAA